MALLSLAAAALIAGSLAFFWRAHGRLSPPANVVSGGIDPSGYLFGRATLKICVDAAGSGSHPSEGQLTETIHGALLDTFASMSRVPDVYRNFTIAVGCPKPTRLDHPRTYLDRNTLREGIPVVGDPHGPSEMSEYRVFVYVVEDGLYKRIFGSQTFASSTEEYVCHSTCIPVTRGLYVPFGGASVGAREGFPVTLDLLTEQQAKQFISDQTDRDQRTAEATKQGN